MAALARNPGAEATGVGVDAQLGCHGTVDDDHLVGAAGGGRRAGEVVGFDEGGADCRDHHGEVLGFAAGHDGVDGQLLQRGAGVSRLHRAQRVLGVGVDGRQHPADGVLGGGHDGQPVGPALLPEVVLHGREGLGDAHATGGEMGGGHGCSCPKGWREETGGTIITQKHSAKGVLSAFQFSEYQRRT